MKKLIFASALAFGLTVSAAPLATELNTNTNNELESVYTTEVSTFVKLITKGDFEAVNSMIVAGTDVNKKSKGMTPLMYAARYNKVKIAKLLIQHGADLKTKSDKGHSALDYAKMSKAKDTYALIAEAIETKKQERKKKRKKRNA